jgi:hypothetical protein
MLANASSKLLLACLLQSLLSNVCWLQRTWTRKKAMELPHRLSRRFLAQLIFWTQKMDARCSSETSVDTHRTTRRYGLPESSCSASSETVALPSIAFMKVNPVKTGTRGRDL